MEYLVFSIVGIIAFLLLAQGVIGPVGFFVVFLFGSMGVFIILVIISTVQDSYDNQKYEKEMQERSAKAKATREKKRKIALEAYPEALNDLHQNLSVIDSFDTSSLTKFYEKVDVICGYCSSLAASKISDKEKLKEVLIYARLNVLSFYESNNIDGAEKLAEKVTKIIKKLK